MRVVTGLLKQWPANLREATCSDKQLTHSMMTSLYKNTCSVGKTPLTLPHPQQQKYQTLTQTLATPITCKVRSATASGTHCFCLCVCFHLSWGPESGQPVLLAVWHCADCSGRHKSDLPLRAKTSNLHNLQTPNYFAISFTQLTHLDCATATSASTDGCQINMYIFSYLHFDVNSVTLVVSCSRWYLYRSQ